MSLFAVCESAGLIYITAKGGTLAQKLHCAHAVPGARAVPVWRCGHGEVTPACDVCQPADVTATAVLRPGGQRRNERPHAAALGCDQPSGQCR